MKEFFKKDGIYLISTLAIFIFTLLLVVVNRVYHFRELFTNVYGLITTLILIASTIYFFFVFRNVDRKELKLEKMFLFIAIPIGLLYCLANPLGRVPDEVNHLLRAYEISEGHFLSQADESGKATRSFNKSLTEITNTNNTNYKEYYSRIFGVNESEKIEKSYSNTALYSPICYLPQAICIFVTRLLRCSFAVQIYSARLGNMALAIALIYFAIKKMPFKKILVILIACLPIAFNECASLAPDCLTNAITLFFIAYILQLKYDNEKMLTNKDYIVLVITTIILSMCKIVYLPMCLLLFLIPCDKFKTKKEKYLKVGLLFAGVVLLNLIWLMFASRFLIEYNEGVNSSKQVKFILTHPIQYCVILLKTLNANFRAYYLCLVGEGLSCLNVGICGFLEELLFLLIGVLFIVNEQNNTKIDIVTRSTISVVWIGILLLIFTSLYVQWTPLQNVIVDGVQGRYFLPILLPFAISINNSKFVTNGKLSYRYILMFLTYVNLHALTCIMGAYI